MKPALALLFASPAFAAVYQSVDYFGVSGGEPESAFADPTDKACMARVDGQWVQEFNAPSEMPGVCSDYREAPRDFSGKPLRARDLSGAQFGASSLGKADLTGATLDGAFFDAPATRKEGPDGRVTFTVTAPGDSRGMILRGASITRTEFYSRDLLGADFRDTKGIRPSFNSGDLSYAKFQDARLRSPTFYGSGGNKIRFDGAELPGAFFFNVDFVNPVFENADLTHARFTGSRLENGNFESATLRGADFTGARLMGSDFSNADLTPFEAYDRGGRSRTQKKVYASFFRANCSGCDFRGSDLSQVDLREAKLEGARFDLNTVLPFSHEEARRRGMVFEPVIPSTEPPAFLSDVPASSTILLTNRGGAPIGIYACEGDACEGDPRAMRRLDPTGGDAR